MEKDHGSGGQGSPCCDPSSNHLVWSVCSDRSRHHLSLGGPISGIGFGISTGIHGSGISIGFGIDIGIGIRIGIRIGSGFGKPPSVYPAAKLGQVLHMESGHYDCLLYTSPSPRDS